MSKYNVCFLFMIYVFCSFPIFCGDNTVKNNFNLSEAELNNLSEDEIKLIGMMNVFQKHVEEKVEITPEELNTIENIFYSEKGEVRAYAFSFLVYVYPAEKCIPLILDGLNSDDPLLRRTAVQGLKVKAVDGNEETILFSKEIKLRIDELNKIHKIYEIEKKYLEKINKRLSEIKELPQNDPIPKARNF